ncbi:Dnajc7, partial [Symbiodinium microadriaticum]
MKDDENDHEDIGDGDDDELSLEQVIIVYNQIKTMVALLEEKLTVSDTPTRDVIYDVKAAAAMLHGDVDDLQCDLDSLSLSSDEEKAERKQINEELGDVYDKVYALDDKCVELLKGVAEAEKKLGNESFKRGSFSDAVSHYTTAISIDPTNSLFYTNRALAFQRLELWAQAIDDARMAVDLDVNFLKGYVILIKSFLATDNVTSCTETLASIPNEFQEQRDVLELKALSATAAKDAGNKHFKLGQLDDAIRFYSLAITCTPDNHLFYSNRSAAYQTKSMWLEALKDAEMCVHVCESFPKGYLHMARCQLQLKRYADAETTVNMAISVLQNTPELAAITPQLNEVVAGLGAAEKGPLNMTDSAKAEQFKQRGNAYYKSEDYQEAVRFYTQAISLCPNEGAYYGNRSAAWLMMKEYKRCVADCLEGIRRETEAGENVENGVASLDKGEFSRSKRLFQNAQSCGMSDAPVVLLGLAKACLGLEDFEEASRCAQKVIMAGGQVSIEAYTLRADALQAMGATDMAQKHMMAALQKDPDNSELQLKLKTLRKNISETSRIRDLIDKAMNARKYEEAIRHCGEGMQIDRNVKKLMAEFHSKRAKAYSMLAKLRCLQDANASIYYDGSDTALPAIFLKCEALQALDRHQEALDQDCFKNGPGEGNRTVREKHKEAQRLLKKAMRVDYYKLIGCIHGEHSSEKEIKTSYRKAALKWHPDRHSSSSTEKKKEAETKFKEISDAYDLLMDPQRRALYDQGYDREEI